jgi:aspartate aminotransferase
MLGHKLNHRIAERVKDFQRRRDLLFDGLKRIRNLEVTRPEGAFYIFPDFSGLIPQNQCNNPNYIYESLLGHGICVIPGKDFTKTRNFDSSVRFSFSATPLEQIQEGVSRLGEIFLSSTSKKTLIGSA